MMIFFKKKPKTIDPFTQRIGDKIFDSMSDEDGLSKGSYHYILPLLPNNQRNVSITQEQLKQLPHHWQMRWQRLDLKKIFAVEPEEPTTSNSFVQIGIDANKPIDVIKVSLARKKDLRTKLKAITFGEVLPRRNF